MKGNREYRIAHAYSIANNEQMYMITYYIPQIKVLIDGQIVPDWFQFYWNHILVSMVNSLCVTSQADKCGMDTISSLQSSTSNTSNQTSISITDMAGNVTDNLCEEQQPGTILDESTGQCVPMSEPDVPIVNGTTNDCEDPGTLMDETTGICAPPPPSIATDTCEEQQPGTILDESTGQCVPTSELDMPVTSPVVCEDPSAILDESTGQCVPMSEPDVPIINDTANDCEDPVL
ncbi:hypothetical protein [Candidatus Nitrosocosmicus sp. T]